MLIALLVWMFIVILFGAYVLPWWFLPICIITPILGIYLQDKFNRWCDKKKLDEYEIKKRQKGEE